MHSYIFTVHLSRIISGLESRFTVRKSPAYYIMLLFVWLQFRFTYSWFYRKRLVTAYFNGKEILSMTGRDLFDSIAVRQG